MPIRKYFIISFFFICLILSSGHIHAFEKMETVAIQLKWFHQFQFAGYYAAIEKGFYAEEGLNVILKERDPDKGYVQAVLNGDTTYGTADAGLLLDRINGKPVVVLKQIFQHSPLVFLSLKTSGITGPNEMVGKKVMFNPEEDAPLLVMLLETLGSLGKIKTVPFSFDYEDLVTGKADVVSAYITDEPFSFEQRNIPINIINPQNYGIDFYGDNLFTTEEEIKNHPERVDKMIRATLKGWKYALEHPKEIIDLIINKYNSKLSREQLAYEAKMTDLMIRPEVTPLGTVTPQRYAQIADIYQSAGLAKLPVDLYGFIYQCPEYVKHASELSLTPEEKEWLEAHPQIRVGIMDAWPPMDFVDDNGTPRGIGVDYIDALNKRLGGRLIIVPGPWKEIYEKVKAKKLDALTGITPKEHRKPYFNFTKPYIKIPHAIVARKDGPYYQNEEDLSGKAIALERGFFLVKTLKENQPETTIKEYDSTSEALEAVAKGEADAYIGNRAVAAYTIVMELLGNLQIQGRNKSTYSVNAIGVRKDWPVLAKILDRALASVTQEEKKTILGRWVKIKDEAHKVPLADEGISFGWLIVYAVILFIVLSLFAWILIRTIKEEDIAAGFGSSRFRLFVLAGLSIFIISVCLLGWFTLERNKEKVLASVGESLKIVLNTANDNFNLWVAQKISFMKLFGRDTELVAITQRLLAVPPNRDDLLASEALQYTRMFFKNNKEIFANIGFFIINPDHISIGSMRDADIGAQNLISTQRPDLLKRAFEGEVLFVEHIHSDVSPGNSLKAHGDGKQDAQFFIGPIRDLNGRIIAVMTLRIDPSKEFSQVLQAYGMLKSGEAYAISREGLLLSESRFNDQLRQIGLIKKSQQSACNIEIRDPGVNMLEGHCPVTGRSQQPLTRMASRAIQLKSDMEKAGQHQGRSKIEVDTKAYRDYRGVPVFGAWLWSADLGVGLTTEIDADEALSTYYMMRKTVFGVLGFTLLLSVGAILFVLILGERAGRALMKARDNLKEKVEERTAELRENQERLAVAEERSRLLLNSAGDGILGVDTGGRLNFVNPSATSMLGYPEEELIGQEVHHLIHHSHADGAPYPLEDCPIVKAYTDGASHHVEDEVLWRKDKTYFHVEYTATPMKKDGRLAGTVFTFNDTTERKRAEEELRQNMEDLERFSKLAVGREERMVNLKKEINEVLRGLGRPDKYKIVD